MRSMSATIGGIGTDLTVPNAVPTAAHSFDLALSDAGQRVIGRMSLLTDEDGTLVDSWIGFTRLRVASMTGTYRCTGNPTTPVCTMSATTNGNVVTTSSSETVTLSSSGTGLAGSIGVPGSQVDLQLTAAPTAD